MVVCLEFGFSCYVLCDEDDVCVVVCESVCVFVWVCEIVMMYDMYVVFGYCREEVMSGELFNS